MIEVVSERTDKVCVWLDKWDLYRLLEGVRKASGIYYASGLYESAEDFTRIKEDLRNLIQGLDSQNS